jgi:hypothetical protein
VSSAVVTVLSAPAGASLTGVTSTETVAALLVSAAPPAVASSVTLNVNVSGVAAVLL